MTTTGQIDNPPVAEPREGGPWAVNSRTVVYGAVGAALYGVLGSFNVIIPGTGNVSIRPAQAITAFIGYRFGPVAGLFTGAVGNAIIDQINGYGFVTYWWWSLANGLVGLVAGLLGRYARDHEPEVDRNRAWPQIWKVAAVSVVAVIVAYLFTVLDIPLTGSKPGAWFATAYLPVILSGGIASVVLSPAIDRVWQPLANRAGR